MAYTIFCDEGVTFTAAELLNVHFAQVKDRRFLEAMERRGGDLYVITMSPAFSDSYQAACEARDTETRISLCWIPERLFPESWLWQDGCTISCSPAWSRSRR